MISLDAQKEILDYYAYVCYNIGYILKKGVLVIAGFHCAGFHLVGEIFLF